MISAAALASILLLIAGIVIAFVNINDKTQEAQQSNRVATPMIGMASKNGPWKECLGMDGNACCELINSLVDVDCQIIPENSMVTMDFREDRVRVFVNDDNVVTHIPSRG